jgi:hypothetical protein
VSNIKKTLEYADKTLWSTPSFLWHQWIKWRTFNKNLWTFDIVHKISVRNLQKKNFVIYLYKRNFWIFFSLFFERLFNGKITWNFFFILDDSDQKISMIHYFFPFQWGPSPTIKLALIVCMLHYLQFLQ